MQFNYILTELSDNILTIQLNRPQKHNALCINMVKELNEAFSNARNNTHLKAIFIFGNEKAFSAGGDLKEMQLLSKAEAEKRSSYVQQTFSILQEIEVPVVAFISGICLGGGLELAMHTDFRICAENARIGLPEVKYGMIPGAGGTVQLPIYFGKADASYFLLTGSDIPLKKALNAGLIQKLVSEHNFSSEIEKQTAYFRMANIDALKAIKAMVKIRENANIEAIYNKEADLFATLLTQQGRKGIDDKFIKNK